MDLTVFCGLFMAFCGIATTYKIISATSMYTRPKFYLLVSCCFVAGGASLAMGIDNTATDMMLDAACVIWLYLVFTER